MRRRRPIPPVRHCRDCGTDLRSWTEGPLCPPCVRALGAARDEGETLREFRQRVIDSGKNT